MTLKCLELAARRAKEYPRVALATYAPLGRQAIEINTSRMNAIARAERLPAVIGGISPKIVRPQSIDFSRELYEQGNSRSVSRIVSDIAPHLSPSDIACLVTYDLEYGEDDAASSMPTIVLSSTTENAANSDHFGHNFSIHHVSPGQLEDSIYRACVSLSLLRIFPFTLMSDPQDRLKFLELVCGELEKRPDAQADALLKATGVPLGGDAAVATTWLKVLSEFLDARAGVVQPEDAASFIKGTWKKVGGAINGGALERLLRESPARVTDHRPPHLQSQGGHQTCLAALLSGDATLLSTAKRPSPERRTRLATLARTRNFRKNACLVLSSVDLDSNLVRSFLEEGALAKYDMRHLRAASLVISDRGA